MQNRRGSEAYDAAYQRRMDYTVAERVLFKAMIRGKSIKGPFSITFYKRVKSGYFAALPRSRYVEDLPAAIKAARYTLNLLGGPGGVITDLKNPFYDVIISTRGVENVAKKPGRRGSEDGPVY